MRKQEFYFITNEAVCRKVVPRMSPRLSLDTTYRLLVLPIHMEGEFCDYYLLPFSFSLLSDAASLANVINTRTPHASDDVRPAAIEAYERRLEQLELDRTELTRKLHGLYA